MVSACLGHVDWPRLQAIERHKCYPTSFSLARSEGLWCSVVGMTNVMEEALASCNLYGRSVSLIDLKKFRQSAIDSFEVVLALNPTHSRNSTACAVIHHVWTDSVQPFHYLGALDKIESSFASSRQSSLRRIIMLRKTSFSFSCLFIG